MLIVLIGMGFIDVVIEIISMIPILFVNLNIKVDETYSILLFTTVLFPLL